MVAVEIDRFEAPPFWRRRFDPVRPERQARPHGCQRIGKAHVALQRVATDTFDTQRSAAKRAKDQEIRG